MNALDQLIPTPRLLELDEVELALPIERAWEAVRYGNLASSPIVRALFAVRTLPSRVLGGQLEPLRLAFDEFVSSPEAPGFQLLADEKPHQLVVGAIGKVWKPDIDFVHVPDAQSFHAFAEHDYVKVAWSIQLSRLGEANTRVALELRVDATDEGAWRKFHAYFHLIGPASRFIRRSALAGLTREHGTPESKENERALAGDELISDAVDQMTHGMTIHATPEVIWPWLVQMGCGRGGFYSYDQLDNKGRRSACEVHEELQHLAVGDVIPATPNGADGFEVLRMTAPSVLVLGGLYDAAKEQQLPFASTRPEHYWQITWAFVLEPLESLDHPRTRLHVRVRAACPETGRMHLRAIRFVHNFMERAQLRHLRARVEASRPRDDVHEVIEGLSGAALMVLHLLTPFLRQRRKHWGLSAAEAARPYPGDELLPEPSWAWTHAVEVAACAGHVWPWVAQMGANKAGFYSYQWLENVAGCNLHNAETVHPEWEVQKGDELRLHPDMPGLLVTDVERGHHFLAYAAPDPLMQAQGKAWVAASWLFFVEPLGPTRCRVISRYRAASSSDLGTRLSFGPTLVEPVGFAMDRRMLLGIKERAEQTQRSNTALRSSIGGSEANTHL